MRIAVISPHAVNNGNTTLSMLIGLEFASTGKLTCLTHAKPVSNSFFQYLNFRGFVDKTTTPSQIVKILKEGSLTGDDARDYCRDIADNLEAFTNTSSNFSQEDMTFMFKYIAKAFPHEHVIFDIDNDIERNKVIIKLCDVVVINITQSIKELDQFQKQKDVILDMLADKPKVVVVNKYVSTKGNLKEVAKWMGVKKPSNWVVLHENPWITWATNHGKLNSLYKNVLKKDPRVIEIHNDMSRICTAIMKAKTSKDKRGVHK